jgi:hypothetical protein
MRARKDRKEERRWIWRHSARHTHTPQETARNRRLNNRLDARILALVKDARTCGTGTISDGTDKMYLQPVLGLLGDPDRVGDPDPLFLWAS